MHPDFLDISSLWFNMSGWLFTWDGISSAVALIPHLQWLESTFWTKASDHFYVLMDLVVLMYSARAQQSSLTQLNLIQYHICCHIAAEKTIYKKNIARSGYWITSNCTHLGPIQIKNGRFVWPEIDTLFPENVTNKFLDWSFPGRDPSFNQPSWKSIQ